MLALTLAASAFAPPTLAPRPASAVRAAEPQMVAKQNFGPIKNPGSGVSGLTRRSPTAIDPRTSARTHTLTYTPDRTRSRPFAPVTYEASSTSSVPVLAPLSLNHAHLLHVNDLV